jgi:hypothetical protein
MVLSGGGDTDKCMPRNLSIGRYSDDVKVCIGFYLDSYSLLLPQDSGKREWGVVSLLISARWGGVLMEL